jgi:hypothetical protein
VVLFVAVLRSQHCPSAYAALAGLQMKQQVDLEEPETPLSAYQHGVATPRRNNLIQVTWAILINTHFSVFKTYRAIFRKKYKILLSFL